MKIEVKKTMGPSIIKSLFLIVIGLLLTFMADATLVSISYILGGILCALGAVAIIQFCKTKDTGVLIGQFNIVYGIITILAGILLILKPSIVGSLIPICIGVLIIISSSIKLQQALSIRDLASAYWKGSLITSLLSLICGLVILFNPFKTASVVTQMIGIFILVYAVLDILSTIMLKKTTTTISMELVDGSEETKSTRKRKKYVKNAKVIKEVKRKGDDGE